MKAIPHLTAAILLALSLGACTGPDPAATAGAEAPAETAAAATPTDEADADEGRGGDAPAAPDQRDLPVVQEAWVSALDPADNIDSPASWTAPDGSGWVIATAKATDRLVIYDAATGATLRTVGSHGTGEVQFDRPNGVAVVDDLLFVVERDNHRVQVLRLPDFGHVASFGADDLLKPYGLWVRPTDAGYTLYVTDAYMAGEDAEGEDILPPLGELDRRIKRYELVRQGEGLEARLAGAFGDTGEAGALRIVESIWGDAANDRLLIAEEDESYANEIKIYTLDGTFSGRTFGGDMIAAQAEGIALKACAGDGGWWVTTEQGKERTVFHLFARDSLEHVGAVAGARVANTDGIWLGGSSERFPQGALFAVHDDQGVVALDWRDIAGTLSLPSCTTE
ncbi:phytase [Coralloluteibacterium stylophorae]|uniref:Phytase n=1 Tax=Coralloluteibacterium stylophorae TaxID=1776034 RepID=A0AAP2C9E6_9GAMM|nr:phytase [Coralloluteibacterium stylophorae]MBS7456387.1 phytase [Coralloluteibacterium stylophorae]